MQAGTDGFGAIGTTGKAIKLKSVCLGSGACVFLQPGFSLLSGWLLSDGAVLPGAMGCTSTTELCATRASQPVAFGLRQSQGMCKVLKVNSRRYGQKELKSVYCVLTVRMKTSG